MEKGRTFETTVGICVLVLAAWFFNYTYTKSGCRTVNVYKLTATFDKVDGLSEGCDVKLNGIKVGKVTKMHLDPKNFMAKVTIQLSNEIRIPKDSSASVTSEGLFGGKYLALTPGVEDETLPENSEIIETTGPTNMESLISNYLFSSDKNSSNENNSASANNNEVKTEEKSPNTQK